MQDPPLPGTRIRVLLGTARYPGVQYQGEGIVRSVDPIEGVQGKMVVEAIVHPDRPLPPDAGTWTILKCEPQT